MSDLIELIKELKNASACLQEEGWDIQSNAVEEAISRLQSLSDQNRLTGGWRAVPETMTAEMKEVAWQCVTVGFVNGLDGTMERFWRHVLAASPPLTLPGGEEKR